MKIRSAELRRYWGYRRKMRGKRRAVMPLEEWVQKDRERRGVEPPAAEEAGQLENGIRYTQSPEEELDPEQKAPPPKKEVRSKYKKSKDLKTPPKVVREGHSRAKKKAKE